MTSIEVIEFRTLPGNGALRAFADVRIGDWIVHDWRILKKGSEAPWIQCPQVSWRDNHGQVRYRTLLTIPAELKKRVEIAILSRWEQENERSENFPR